MGPLALTTAALLLAAPAAPLQQPQASDKPPKLIAADVTDVVTIFFKNWEQKELTRSETLFLNPDVPVVVYDNYQKRQDVIQSEAGDLLKKWQADPAKFLRVESTKVDVVNGSLAVARSEYVLGGFNGRGVFTLIYRDGRWRIASLVMEHRFTW